MPSKARAGTPSRSGGGGGGGSSALNTPNNPNASTARSPSPSAANTSTSISSSSTSSSTPGSSKASGGKTGAGKSASASVGSGSGSGYGMADAQEVLEQLWHAYVERTPPRTKLVDAFMAFLLVVGAVQFGYCVLFGNYPYNAFLAGFGMTVGQFVLTASLRIQTNAENAKEFRSVSPERAFADFVFGSLLLHFFCVNFIN